MPNRILESTLVAGDPSELKMTVGTLQGLSRRNLESRNGVAILPALLVDQAELIVRVSVVRIGGRDLELLLEVLPGPESSPKDLRSEF